MSPKNTTAIAVCAFFLSLTACSKNDQAFLSSGEMLNGMASTDMTDLESKTLQVVDLNGKPLAQAQVLIGSGLNQPFASNFLTTDSSGSFQAPTEWTAPQMVTVGAEGFVRATFIGQVPAGQKFVLRPSAKAVSYELKGKGVGFTVKNNDNRMDFALMMPVLTKGMLFAFDLNSFISPKTDVVTVMGQKLELPSNVSVPKQSERYGIFPVTLEKVGYRLYFDSLGRQQVFAIRGQFPFKEVVDEFQSGKTFADIINYISLKGGSFKEANITGATQVLDLPVNEIAFNQTRSLKSPQFQNDEVLFAAPLLSVGGALMPTDLKNVPANKAFNLTIANGESQLLLALKKKAEAEGSERFSAVILPFQAGVQPELLQMTEKPHVTNLHNVRLAVPSRPTSVVPVATHSVLSSVGRYDEAGKSYEIVTPFWDVYAREWVSDLNLPVWPDDVVPEGKKRWGATFVAAPTANKAVDLSPGILETVTHATHSASDF